MALFKILYSTWNVYIQLSTVKESNLLRDSYADFLIEGNLLTSSYIEEHWRHQGGVARTGCCPRGGR